MSSPKLAKLKVEQLASLQKVSGLELNEKAAYKRKMKELEEEAMLADPKAARKIDAEREK